MFEGEVILESWKVLHFIVADCLYDNEATVAKAKAIHKVGSKIIDKINEKMEDK